MRKNCDNFPLCDPGWCVHKSDVQNKWDDNTTLQTTQLVKCGTFSFNKSIGAFYRAIYCIRWVSVFHTINMCYF